MRRWGRTRGVESEAYARWRATLTEVTGRQPRILAWAPSADGGLVILSPAALSVQGNSGQASAGQAGAGQASAGQAGAGQASAGQAGVGQAGGAWWHLGWHEIERGGWNGETGRLHWQTYDGRRGAVALRDPDRLPAVFRERVAASIVFERLVPLTAGGDRGVVVNGRRDLADQAAEISWHATLTRGVTWHTPGVGELAEVSVAEIRREYDGG